MTVLPLTALTIIPSTGNHVWKGQFEMLYIGTGRIEQNGDMSNFKLDITDLVDSSNNMVVTGEYDQAKDSFERFVNNEDVMLAVDNNKGYAVIDGKKTSFE